MLLTFSAVLTIADHVRANPTREVGGLLFGDGDLIAEAAPLPNAAVDVADEFAIEPEHYAKAVAAGEREGVELLGTFHSHPNGKVELSRADVALARQTGVLLIVATGATWSWALYDPGGGSTNGLVEAHVAFPYSQTWFSQRSP